MVTVRWGYKEVGERVIGGASDQKKIEVIVVAEGTG